MKIGDLVKNIEEPAFCNFIGIVVEIEPDGEPVVFWNEQFPYELEYGRDLKVITNENM
jgi:hypothetical protein